MEKPNFKKMCLMYVQQLTNFPYIEKDFDALTDYQLLCKVVAYLNKIIINENKQNDAITNLYNAFVELKDYVDNYFDNLDVQDEINNKLDEMVEDGTFDEIINHTLFDNLDKSLNDSNYYNINYTTGRKYDTDYYVVVIPKQINNEEIPIYVDVDNNKTPLQYAEVNKTTITTNAGMTYQNSSQQWIQNLVIGNGQILNPVPLDISLPNYYTFLGFDENRNVYEYQANTLAAQQALNDGVKNGYVVFYRYMNNGVLEEHTEASNWEVESPRLDIGIKANGDIVILACDGRTDNNVGLTNVQALEIMQEFNCIKAWRTDGGGSASLNYKGSKINRNIDDNGTSDRRILVTFNVKKPTVNEERADIYSFIGRDRQLLNKQIRNDLLENFNNYEHKRSRFYYYVNDNSRNNIVAADTYQLAKFNGKYKHNDDILPLRDEDNNVVGFTLQKSGLCRIVVVANFESQGSGDKIIKITKGDNDELEWFQDIQVSENTTIYKQMICETMINNRVDSPLPIKIWIRSSHAGDRFIRMTAFAETLGVADSN